MKRTLDTKFIKPLVNFIKPYWVWLAAGLGASMVFAGIDAYFTYLLKPLMDQGFIEHNRAWLTQIPLLVLFAFSLRGVVSFISSYCMTYVARSVVMNVRQTMFNHMLRLPANFYDHHSSGQLLSKLIYDVEQIAQISTSALTNFMQSLFFVIALFVVMFTVSWRLTLIYLALVPIIAVIVRLTNKRVRAMSQAVQDAMVRVTHIAEECIEGYQVVRLQGGQAQELHKFNEASRECRRRDLHAALAQAVNVAGVQVCAAAGVSLIIFLSLEPTYSTALSAGGFVAIVAAMLALLKPLKNLSNVSSIIQRGLAGLESVLDFIDEKQEEDVLPVKPHEKLANTEPHIVFNHVSFAYDDKPVLEDIYLEVPTGESVALVGRSGGGKTSLVKLLARFYAPSRGDIYLHGRSIASFSLSELRRQIAWVSQNVVLFNDTVANNIAYGLENVSKEAIHHAAKVALADEFIERLPQGFDTLIGENGVLLSGGQRQRIAIARAIIQDTPILILDEATSALDNEAERLIQAALDNVMKDRTTIVIAHRLSTIERASQIIVIDNGRVVERGNHAQLLETDGYYAHLHRLQFGSEHVTPA